MVVADTSASGSEFQSLTTLLEKENFRTFSLECFSLPLNGVFLCLNLEFKIKILSLFLLVHALLCRLQLYQVSFSSAVETVSVL